MNHSDFGQKADIIGQMTDANALTAMLKNPQYQGYTAVIIARLNEIKQERGAAQAQQPAAPTVVQQTLDPRPPAAPMGIRGNTTEPPQQAMAKGGIVAFKHGGEVKQFADGGEVSYSEMTPEQKQAVFAMRTTDPQGYAAIMARQNTPAPTDGPSHSQVDTSGVRSYTPLEAWLTPSAPKPKPTAPKAGPKQGAPAEVPTQVDPTAERSDWLHAHPAKLNPVGGGVMSISAADLAALAEDSKAKPLAEYLKELQGDPDKTRDEDRANLRGRADNAFNMAMIRSGLGMAQSASEHPLYGSFGNFAEGAGQGLGQYTKETDSLADQQMAMNKDQRTQEAGIRGLAVQERGQDARARAAAIRGQLQNDRYMQMQGKEWQATEQDVAQRAQEILADSVVNGQPTITPMQAKLKAKHELDYRFAGVDQRVGMAQANARMAAAQKELAGGMATPQRQLYLQSIIDNNGEDPYKQEAPAAAGTVRPR